MYWHTLIALFTLVARITLIVRIIDNFLRWQAIFLILIHDWYKLKLSITWICILECAVYLKDKLLMTEMITQNWAGYFVRMMQIHLLSFLHNDWHLSNYCDQKKQDRAVLAGFHLRITPIVYCVLNRITTTQSSYIGKSFLQQHFIVASLKK